MEYGSFSSSGNVLTAGVCGRPLCDPSEADSMTSEVLNSTVLLRKGLLNFIDVIIPS